VVVIDKNTAAFARLGESFTGRTMLGVGFDRGMLSRAGVTAESAVLAVTSGDNSNILIARVARETFGVERVVARIYDPRRAVIYERLGIPTVASVAWTAGRALRHVLPNSETTEWIDPSAAFGLIERRVPVAAAGRSIAQVEQHGVRVALLTRYGVAQLPTSTMLLQQDDLLHVILPAGHEHDVFADIEGNH
jgi:trk system potassium uptake protein TrkA